MKKLVIIFFLISFSNLFSQDSLAKKEVLTYSGYLKDLFWARMDKDLSIYHTTNLVHNRINLKWNPSERISGRLEVRNRFYWGDDVRILSTFKDALRNPQEWANLSVTWFDNRSTVFHSNVERLWLEYRRERWNVRGGRQRINWGITNTWNPNDLFNTYNFLDFDYEERPGSDAVKFQYNISDFSNIEIAYAATNGRPIAAAKYATNYKEYDLQLVAGLYRDIFTAGFGWAGSISDVGFKGEAQFYTDKKDSASSINVTIEGDYAFENGWYLSSGILFNQQGLRDPLKNDTEINFDASPRNLMPARWNFIINASKEFTPIFNGSFSIVYSPEVNLFILYPSFRYNLMTNLDLDFIWQSFFGEMNSFQAISHVGFVRLKWSF